MAHPMSLTGSQIDQTLDEWGSRLFNVSTETLPRPRSSKYVRLSSNKFVSTGRWLSTPQARATYVQRQDFPHIRLGVCTAGAINRPLSDLRENNLYAENP
ncbi:MAG: hypothetical protein U0223_07390 [Nitrospira sp.]